MPSELGRIKLAGRITSIQVANNTAYVGLREQWNYDYSEFLPWDTGGLQIVDVSTPTLPTSIGLYYGGSTTAAVVVDTYAYVYVRGSESMEVVDIADAAYPKRISFVHGVVPRGFGRTEITSITVVGDYAYLASWLCHRSCTGDVYTMSLAEPSQPVVIGRGNRRWSSLGGFSDIIVVDHYAYVVQSSLLVIYDIFDPTQLIWLEHRNFLESDDSYRIGRKLVRADEHVYVTAYTGLLILDISDAANPTKVGFYEEVQDLWEIAIVDSYAYVIRREGGLYVLDISSPRAPVLVGHYQVMQP